MDKNKFSVVGGGKEEEKENNDLHQFIVTYDDGEEKKYTGHYMGHSSEYSPMMVILKNDVGGNENPVVIVNTDKIRRIEVVQE